MAAIRYDDQMDAILEVWNTARPKQRPKAHATLHVHYRLETASTTYPWHYMYCQSVCRERSRAVRATSSSIIPCRETSTVSR